jgi:hypothetical protein
MNKSLCSSRDRLSCARSRDSRHAVTLEGKALVTPVGWNIKAESEDSARGPAAKPRPAGEMLKLRRMIGTSRLGDITAGTRRVGSQIPADNLPYGVKDTVVCFYGGMAPTRRKLTFATITNEIRVTARLGQMVTLSARGRRLAEQPLRARRGSQCLAELQGS